MKKLIPAMLLLILIFPLTACNKTLITSCNYNINFFKYDKQPDFTEIITSTYPEIPMDKTLALNFPKDAEEIIKSDTSIIISLSKSPTDATAHEYWLTPEGEFITTNNEPFSTTGNITIHEQKLYLMNITHPTYGFYENGDSDGYIRKGYTITVTFEDNTVENYAFIVKSKQR